MEFTGTEFVQVPIEQVKTYTETLRCGTCKMGFVWVDSVIPNYCPWCGQSRHKEKT